MQIYKIYPDYLDVSWIDDTGFRRNLIARKCSIYERHANATSLPSQYEESTQWEQWGKELAKL